MAKGLGGNLPYLKNEFPTQFGLLARKDVYPYEYMNSFKRFDETELPPIEAFASSWNNFESLKICDYKHACEVWNEMRCKTLGDYHDLYLKTDVL